MPIKYFSMFSGIGGFEYGMELSDHEFECVGYCEIDKYARSIYERHYPNHINYGDATEIRTEELPDFDFLVGGFPCQAFSIAGKRKGFDDTRGTLFFEIARILRDKKPRHFLLENVKGLLSHDKGETFKTILEILNELRYDVSWAIYNSKNHGVPQNRERIFIKGYSREKCGSEILFKRKECQESDGKLIVLNNKKQAQQVYDINGIATTLCANGGGQGGKTGLYAINVTSEGNARAITTRQRDSFLSKRQEIYILEECLGSTCSHASRTDGSYSPTLTANNYGVSTPVLKLKSTLDSGRYIIRRLTPLECERLQGFPEEYTKYGKDDELISDTQRYKCIGNAVTTTVIRDIINEVFG